MFTYAKPEQKQSSKKAVQKKEVENPATLHNLTGIPDQMKTRFENLSGFSFDDVRVHYNSDKPAQLQALAYTQGNQVHIAPGQEKHLGHELGHVVQQKQRRVYPSFYINGKAINMDSSLEQEADTIPKSVNRSYSYQDANNTIQRKMHVYARDKINDFLNMTVTFVTQGCDVVFDNTCKYGSNWISRTMVIKTWSREKQTHLTFSAHLNITFSGASYNDSTNAIQINLTDIHWTIRSTEDQSAIDKAKSSTTEAKFAFHKSTGRWNTGSKALADEEETIRRIGGSLDYTSMAGIDIMVTKEDLISCITYECRKVHPGATVDVLF